MLTYDPRTISTQVYGELNQLRDTTTANIQNPTKRQEAFDKQRNQAVELYTYIAAWGLLRLKGEEPALRNEAQKQAIVQCFFRVLGRLAFPEHNPSPLQGLEGIEALTQLHASEYLGLTGLGLQVAREFSFWAEALYPRSTSTTATPTVPAGEPAT